MYSQFAHIASDEAIKDSGVNLEKIDTEGRIILAKQESSLNRLKIAFYAYYFQQKVNRRETDEKTSAMSNMNTSKHRIYSQKFISDLHSEIMQQIKNCQTEDELNRIVQENINLITGSKAIDLVVYKRRCEIIQHEKQI